MQIGSKQSLELELQRLSDQVNKNGQALGFYELIGFKVGDHPLMVKVNCILYCTWSLWEKVVSKKGTQTVSLGEELGQVAWAVCSDLDY